MRSVEVVPMLPDESVSLDRVGREAVADSGGPRLAMLFNSVIHWAVAQRG